MRSEGMLPLFAGRWRRARQPRLHRRSQRSQIGCDSVACRIGHCSCEQLYCKLLTIGNAILHNCRLLLLCDLHSLVARVDTFHSHQQFAIHGLSRIQFCFGNRSRHFLRNSNPPDHSTRLRSCRVAGRLVSRIGGGRVGSAVRSPFVAFCVFVKVATRLCRRGEGRNPLIRISAIS